MEAYRPSGDVELSWWERLLLRPGVPGHTTFGLSLTNTRALAAIILKLEEIDAKLDELAKR